jgi:fluoride exporter
MTLYTLFAIGIGGFLGAVSRYLVANRISILIGASFPFGTLAVNAIGSFLLGFLSRFLLEHFIVDELVRVGILVGFLGAFTTYSTFSYESVVLLQEGDFLKAALNIIANTTICIILCLSGLQIAKAI